MIYKKRKTFFFFIEKKDTLCLTENTWKNIQLDLKQCFTTSLIDANLIWLFLLSLIKSYQLFWQVPANMCRQSMIQVIFLHNISLWLLTRLKRLLLVLFGGVLELLLLYCHVFRHSSDEKICVQVESICSWGTLSFNHRLIVHAQHGITPITHNYELMPATRLYHDLTDN